MRRSIAVAALLVLFTALPWKAQAQKQQDEIFGGYSYVHATLGANGYVACPVIGIIPTCTDPFPAYTSDGSLNGWEAALAYKFSHRLGVAADFSGNYGSPNLSSPTYGGTTTTHLYTYLFGPQVSWPGRISPFVRVLAGGAHESESSSTAPYEGLSNTSSFAAAFGGGVDIKVAPHISIRAIQFQELLTRFNLGTASTPLTGTQFQPQISAGLVIHFNDSHK